ncbi:MAG: polysaccharide deacetylase family protein [Candidatus Nitrosocosmicus sp.]
MVNQRKINFYSPYIFISLIIFLFVDISAQSSGHYSDAITDNHNLQLLKENELQHQLNISQLHISSSAGNLSSTFQMPNIIQTLPSKSPLPLSSKVNGNINSTISDSSTNANKVIILTFGDGYQSQYTIAKPILDEYGYKGNFFVTCNKIGSANKMTWAELVQLYKEGNVIGSKTVDYGTKAMEGKDLNHLSAQQLEFEVGQSKQCLINHGIKTDYFAVPMNLANNNSTVINTIAKYYTLAINGHADQIYLHCDGYKKNSSQTDCRTYFDNGTLTFANRYSIGEWSEQHIKNGRSYNDSQMFAKFITVVNSQNKFNKNGVTSIPLIAYHDIVMLPDISLSNEPSATTLNLFNGEMKYLHDNGFRVLTFYNLGYDNKNNVFQLNYDG